MSYRFWMKSALIMAAVFALGTVAYAQGTDTSAGNVSLRAGIVWPHGKTVDNSTGIYGIEYKTPLELGNGALTLSADYIRLRAYKVGSTTDTHNVSLVPVLVNYRMESKPSNGGNSLYGGVGAGSYYASDKVAEMNLKDKWTFGWQVFAGINFDSSYFGEIRYIAGKHPKDDGLIGLQVGARF